MRLIDKLRSVFKKVQNSEAEERLLANISQQLDLLASELASQLEAQASGVKGDENTVFDYIVMDMNGGELQTEWQDIDHVTSDDIRGTDGYGLLKALIIKEGLQIELLNEQIEEVDDEERERFIIRISGWAD